MFGGEYLSRMLTAEHITDRIWGSLVSLRQTYAKKGRWKASQKRRKPSVDVERVRELRDSGMGASAIAKEMGIARASVYRALG
jgi:DNA invertase Pin-like site-specific DNA recombinase